MGHDCRLEKRDPCKGTATVSNTIQTLERMTQALKACEQGQLAQKQLIAQWRSDAASLALPVKYGEVLGNLLDRMESSALFSEESCSFSPKEQFAGLRVWLEKAGQTLASN